MFRIDNASAASPIPTPGPVGPNPDSFFADGSTVVSADWLNAVQEELAYIIDASPSSPSLSKTDRTQVYTAILDILNIGTYSAINYNNLYYIEDQKATTVDGGSASAATWNIRTLNTEVVSNISGASLSTNQVTLPSGTYWVEAMAPCYSNTDQILHKLRFRNITDSTDDIIGQAAVTDFDGTGGSQTIATLSGPLVIGAIKIFELQHYTSAADATDGLGKATSDGTIEKYANLKIWKVA